MRMVILGPPGSGKGTRAQIIGKIYDIPVITTGDMLRDSASRGTEQGKIAKAYMEKGELVPDEIVIGVMRERLRKPDVGVGFILDGYPRNLTQARALDLMLEEKGESLDFVLNVSAKPKIIISRLSLRRSCPKCGAVYHLKDKPPKTDEICDECGAKLIQRSDDKEEVIMHRLKVYEEETSPLLQMYGRMGKVREISGDLSIGEIPEAIRRVLA